MSEWMTGALFWTGAIVWAVAALLGAFVLLMLFADWAIDLIVRRFFVLKEFFAFVQSRLEAKE